MSETDRVRERYARREAKAWSKPANFMFAHHAKCERELMYFTILRKTFGDFHGKRLLEIGAGSGDNLLGFARMGFPWSNLAANELLEDRGIVLRANAPAARVHIGDAMELPDDEKFDIIFQSTVFTSLLDQAFKKNLAAKLWSLLQPGGLVLWYDFVYDNPKNPDVKGIGRREIRELFPRASRMEFHSVTLAPPLGRRVGKLYPIVNFLFPVLRTHVVAAIHSS